MMEIHFTDLATLYPSSSKTALQAAVDPLNKTAEHYDISTGNRMAAFISQVGHESAGFTAMAENLNYGAAGLLATFPSHFTKDQANEYARQPQKIAARVYASRMGNGPETSGDGWTYRGRGYLQVTGKSAYQRFANDMKMSLADVVAYLETPMGAAMSAGWFWNNNGLNTLADQGLFTKITIKINGGKNGLPDRLDHYLKAKKLFG